MATTKRTTTKTSPSPDPVVEPAVPAETSAGVSANLLQFVDPEAAAKVATEPEVKTESTAADVESDKDDGTGPASVDTEEEPAVPAETVVEHESREYVVLATALGGADGRVHTAGSTISLDDDQASWLLSRGLVKLA